MEKRTLTALALSFLVLGFYPVLMEKFYPDYYKKSSAPAAQKSMKASSPAPASLSKADTLSFSDDVRFSSRELNLIFNQKGGGIREIAFPEYQDSGTKSALKLLSLHDAKAQPTAIRVLRSGETLSQDAYRVSIASNDVSAETSLENGELKISKTYAFKQNYAADLRVSFQNTSQKPVTFHYELYAGGRIPPRHSIDEQYIEANFFMASDKTPLRHIRENRLGKEVQSSGFVDWVAVKDRHFSVILKPKQEMSFTGLVRGLGNHQFSASLVSSEKTLAPGASLEETFTLYLGPNIIENLLPLGLGDLINFGKMDGIGKVLVGAMDLLHKLFNNYGVSIVALTILINLLLFPLTRTSYMSLKRMQLVQPQMTKLREQYKKNPEKLNKEMMELYRKHKVNPFGGCLPMLIQMPVFIALYVALSKSVTLINSNFLWVKDLSSPDAVGLPLSLPFLGNEIHVLPLIMVAAMAFQQRFTQIKMEGQDPAMESQQKMMAVMMPIIFGFIFYSMPSGLVIYWLTNTILMTLYQLHLKKVTLT